MLGDILVQLRNYGDIICRGSRSSYSPGRDCGPKHLATIEIVVNPSRLACRWSRAEIGARTWFDRVLSSLPEVSLVVIDGSLSPNWL